MVFGKKKQKAASEANASVADVSQLPPLEIKALGIPKDHAQGLMIASRQLPGYPISIVTLANAISSRADRILMDFSAQGAVVRYRIDGNWETLPPLDRATADATLIVYKKMLGLNPAERRAVQEAKFATNFREIDWVVSFRSAGVPNGERVLFQIDRKKTSTQVAFRPRHARCYAGVAQIDAQRQSRFGSDQRTCRPRFANHMAAVSRSG